MAVARTRRAGGNRGAAAARGGGRLVGNTNAAVARRNQTIRNAAPGGAIAGAVAGLRTRTLRAGRAIGGAVRSVIGRVLGGGTRAAPQGTRLGTGTRAPATRPGSSGAFRFNRVGTPAEQRAYRRRYTYWTRQRAAARASRTRGAIGRVERAARAEGMQGFAGGGI